MQQGLVELGSKLQGRAAAAARWDSWPARGGTAAPMSFGFVESSPVTPRSLSLSLSLSPSGSVEAAALEDGEPGRQ
jgi:hypothetical protein